MRGTRSLLLTEARPIEIELTKMTLFPARAKRRIRWFFECGWWYHQSSPPKQMIDLSCSIQVCAGWRRVIVQYATTSFYAHYYAAHDLSRSNSRLGTARRRLGRYRENPIRAAPPAPGDLCEVECAHDNSPRC